MDACHRVKTYNGDMLQPIETIEMMWHACMLRDIPILGCSHLDTIDIVVFDQPDHRIHIICA